MFVYLVHASGSSLFKIGYSRDPERRLKSLQTANGAELKLACVYESRWAPKMERTLHRTYASSRASGEWFELSDADVASFARECERMDRTFTLIEATSTKSFI